MTYVYVMSRKDGWHKVGISVSPYDRLKSVNLAVPPETRPVFILKAYLITDGSAERVERIAHAILEERGASRAGEWFSVSSRVCMAAVDKARKLFKEHGPRDWRKVVEKPTPPAPKRPKFEIIRDGRLLRSDAKRRWFNKRWHTTDEDALSHMDNWTLSDALREFGPSGR